MVYRIRYRLERAEEPVEVVVEANSPTEALVKFRHIHRLGGDAGLTPQTVTSICAEDDRQGRP